MALKDNMPMQFGLLAGGAAMLDPRGTQGKVGSAINKGMQAGLGTMIPLMQWQQNKKDRKEDRDWNKEQDMIRNVLAERQFKMRSEALESESENRAERTNLARAQYGLAKQKMDYDIAELERKNAALSQFTQMSTLGVPRSGAVDQSKIGPRVGNVGKGLPPDAYRPATYPEMAVGAAAAGIEPGVANMLMKGQFSKTDPDSPYASASVGTMKDIDTRARELLAAGDKRSLSEIKLALRKEQQPDSGFAAFAGTPAGAAAMAERLKNMP